MLRGGHFAPVEAPELVVADIAAFFGDLSKDQIADYSSQW
jgi:hypothetical protein